MKTYELAIGEKLDSETLRELFDTPLAGRIRPSGRMSMIILVVRPSEVGQGDQIQFRGSGRTEFFGMNAHNTALLKAPTQGKSIHLFQAEGRGCLTYVGTYDLAGEPAIDHSASVHKPPSQWLFLLRRSTHIQHPIPSLLSEGQLPFQMMATIGVARDRLMPVQIEKALVAIRAAGGRVKTATEQHHVPFPRDAAVLIERSDDPAVLTQIYRYLDDLIEVGIPLIDERAVYERRAFAAYARREERITQFIESRVQRYIREYRGGRKGIKAQFGTCDDELELDGTRERAKWVMNLIGDGDEIDDFLAQGQRIITNPKFSERSVLVRSIPESERKYDSPWPMPNLDKKGTRDWSHMDFSPVNNRSPRDESN